MCGNFREDPRACTYSKADIKGEQHDPSEVAEGAKVGPRRSFS